METTQTQKEQMEVAQMRFGTIAPLVQGTYTDVSMAAYCRRVAQPLWGEYRGRVYLKEYPKSNTVFCRRHWLQWNWKTSIIDLS